MPERTIDVLNGDGSTRTITIPDRSKYAGVRTIETTALDYEEITVSNAASDVNGTWVLNGTSDGRPRWRHSTNTNTYIWRMAPLSNKWVIQDDDNDPKMVQSDTNVYDYPWDVPNWVSLGGGTTYPNIAFSNQFETLTINRTAPVIDSDRAGESRPLLSKLVGKAAVAYSLRDLNDKAGSSKVVRVRRSADNQEEDFTAKKVKKVADWVNGKQETTLPADVASAATAYSLRKVRSAYTGNAVQIRRTSDNVEVDVAFDANDEVSDSSAITVTSGSSTATTIEDFLTEDVTIYQSDFSSGTTGWSGTEAVPVANQDGISDGTTSKDNVLKLTKAVDSQGFVQRNQFVKAGSTYVVSGSFYAPSSNTAVDSLLVKDGFVGGSLSDYPSGYLLSSGVWTDFSFTYTAAVSGLQRLNMGISSLGSNPNSSVTGSTGDVLYIADLRFVEQTADASVVTWYDQSGNGNDATQDTTGNQPLIAENGSLNKDSDNNISVKFDSSEEHHLNNTTLPSSFTSSNATFSDFTVQEVFQNDATGVVFGFGSTGSSFFRLNKLVHSLGNYGYQGLGSTAAYQSAFDTAPYSANDVFLGSGLRVGTDLDIFKNSADADMNNTFDTGTIPLNVFAIGAYIKSTGVTSPFNGNITELIIYDSDQSNNRFKIESNINNYYGLYTTAGDGFVSTWYDQSGREKHSVQDNDITRQPKIVDATDGYLEAVDFDGTQYFEKIPMATGVLSDIQNTHAVWIGKRRNNSSGIVCMASSAGGDAPRLYYRYSTVTLGNNPILSLNLLAVDGVDTICSVTGESGTYNTYVNGVDKNSTSVTALTGARDFSFGASINGNSGLDGTIKEFVLYDTDEAHNRRAIEANVANQYGITLTS